MSTADKSDNSTDYQHRVEAGRRFHSLDAPWALPNDEDEQSRLQALQNHHKAHWDTNILAPIPPNPSLIADIGTGPGHWCIEVARDYPNAQVVGTDLSPMQSENFPANCKFLTESLLDGLSLETGSVDYLQSRSVVGGVPLNAWPGYVAEIFRVLKPGVGWAVFLEPNINWRSDDGSLPEDSYVRQWQRMLTDFLGKKGIPMDIGEKYLGDFVKARGFVDISVDFVNLPNGTWPEDPRAKVVGAYSKLVFGKGIDSSEPILRQTLLELTDTQRQDFMNKVRTDIENDDYHSYTLWTVVKARKPDVEASL